MRIAIKELTVFRDIKMLVFMLATPILLMLIMGAAFSNAFNESATVGDIEVLYKINNADPALAAHWEAFTQEADQSGISFVKTREQMDGKLEAQNGQYTGYLEVTDSGMNYYGNSGSSLENSIVQGMLTAFTDRYKLTTAAIKFDLEQDNGQENYVNETSLQVAKKPGSLDYFAIAVTTLIILYSALSAGMLIENERKRNTAARLLASPITKADILIGKIVGNLLLNALFVIIIVLISKYMFGANWGENVVLVFLVLFTEIVLALGLGLGISYVIKGSAAGSVIMIIIQLAALFGGSYSPVENNTGFMSTLSYYSPLRWSNDAIMQIIYADNLSAAIPAMVLNVGFTALLLIVTIVSMRRREGL
ncbi:MAG: ABC transporter permease [Candidatus Pristimantibacillus sp.]